MQKPLDQFKTNMSRVRNLRGIFNFLESQTSTALDLSDLLRNELVMIVSALDLYIHELVRLGMLEAYEEQRPRTEAFLRFQISLGSFFQRSLDYSSTNWLENEIRTRHSYQSFQTPDKIAEVIHLISDVSLWNEVAMRLGSTVPSIKLDLSAIIARRNKIAHEADVNPAFPNGELWPIDEILVNNAVNFIEQLVQTIHLAVV